MMTLVVALFGVLLLLVKPCRAVQKKPFPKPMGWKWNDAEHNRKRDQILLEWANEHDKDREESLLQLSGEEKHKMSVDEARLARWHMRLKEKIEAEKDIDRESAARRRAIAAIQVGIAQRHDRRASSPELEKVAKSFGGEEVLRNVKKVAKFIKTSTQRHGGSLSSFLEIESKKETKKGIFGDNYVVLGQPGSGHVADVVGYGSGGEAEVVSGSESGSGGETSTEASGFTTTEGPNPNGEEADEKASAADVAKALFGDFGAVPPAGDPVKCIMCLYIMEMTERDVGFPQRDFYSDVYPSYSSRNQGAPGPASYFRNFGGSVSQPPGAYNPIPGPGYSFLETMESTKNPVGAWAHSEDFSTISTPSQNLRARRIAENAALMKHDDDLKAEEGAGRTDMYSMYENAFESQYARQNGKSSLRKSAAKWSEAIGLNSGKFSSMLEESESTEDYEPVPTAFVETGFAGALSALGFTVCRPGKKYCRPRMKQPGRRQLERRVMMQAIKSEYAEMEGLMKRSMMDTCENMPMAFKTNCKSMMTDDLTEIAEKYLHDYDDDEICTDLKYCTIKQLNVPQEPYVLKFPIP